MDKSVLLLLALGLFTAVECRRSLRGKRASQLSVNTERREVCIEGLGCYPGGSTEVDDESWVGPEMGKFIADLIAKTFIQVEDIHIIGHRLDVHVSGKKTGDIPPEQDETVPPEVDEIVPPQVDEIVPPQVDEIVPPEVDEIVLKPMDCQEVMEAGHTETGMYEVWPKGGGMDGRSVRVWCDMDTDGGGWTVIQRRGNYLPQENFDRNWQDYKNGFGNLIRDFWIGNDNIYALTNQGAYSARFDMVDADRNAAYELYGEFRIEDESSGYKLHISNPSGTAGDRMTRPVGNSGSYTISYDGRKFSAKDKRNDQLMRDVSCAQRRKSGFWWNGCGDSNPNGVYQPGKEKDESVMHWSLEQGGLSFMEIKLKRL